MRAQALVLSLTLAATIAASPGDQAKDDLKQLQGDWTITSMEEGATKVPDDILKGMAIQIKDDGFTVKEKDRVSVEFRFKLDPSKTPRAVDFTYLTGLDKGRTVLGIYRLAGDTVTFCVSEPGKERPKDFTRAADTMQNLVVVKRKK
jgi:uncharacterized protein (TIGR03067 family)